MKSTCVISVIRLFTLQSAIETADPTWDNVPVSYWTVIELNCGILCASLPCLRPFWHRPSGGSSSLSSPAYSRDAKKLCERSKSSGIRQGMMYSLHEVAGKGSQEVLKEHAAGRGLSQSFEFEHRPDVVAKITTAVSGGKKVTGSVNASDSDSVSSPSLPDNSYPPMSPRIIVTTETVRRETRN